MNWLCEHIDDSKQYSHHLLPNVLICLDNEYYQIYVNKTESCYFDCSTDAIKFLLCLLNESGHSELFNVCWQNATTLSESFNELFVDKSNYCFDVIKFDDKNIRVMYCTKLNSSDIEFYFFLPSISTNTNQLYDGLFLYDYYTINPDNFMKFYKDEYQKYKGIIYDYIIDVKNPLVKCAKS